MSAKEMFEKLGWFDVSKKYRNLIRYEKYIFENDIPIITSVEFETGAILNGKNEVYFMTRYDGASGCTHITAEELQAINKQVEELGWNKCLK